MANDTAPQAAPPSFSLLNKLPPVNGPSAPAPVNGPSAPAPVMFHPPGGVPAFAVPQSAPAATTPFPVAVPQTAPTTPPAVAPEPAPALGDDPFTGTRPASCLLDLVRDLGTQADWLRAAGLLKPLVLEILSRL